jgi:hypothetical protein
MLLSVIATYANRQLYPTKNSEIPPRIFFLIVYMIKGIGIMATHDGRRGVGLEHPTPLINTGG